MLRKICIPLSLLLVFVSNVRCNSSTIRQTLNGPIEGIELISSLGQKYVAFKGVRYAMPPITGIDPTTGDTVDRRFKAPEPLERSWTIIRIAQSYGKACIPSDLIDMDSGDDAAQYSEDCLFLNIYVPAGGSSRKTVLVYIHGGSFNTGDATDSTYGPDFLLSQDNIVVTLQYRLGIFGFLNLNYGEYTGNMGLKDQQLALKWVYENIEYFSGQKNEILLFGQSSGAVCVHFHLLNEESRKYFSRFYLMSSSALTVAHKVVRQANDVQNLQEYTKIREMNDLIGYLKRANITVLNKYYQSNTPAIFAKNTWKPAIESPNTIGAFMTKTYAEVYHSAKAPIMDAMFSFTSQEILPFSPFLLLTTKPILRQNWMKSDTKFTQLKKYQQGIEKLRDEYFRNTTNVMTIKNANIASGSDLIFSNSMIKATMQQVIVNNRQEKQRKNTFLFKFSARSNLKFHDFLRRIPYNATHGDDLCYLFHIHKFDQDKLYDMHLKHKDDVYDMIMRSVKIITNFARTG